MRFQEANTVSRRFVDFKLSSQFIECFVASIFPIARRSSFVCGFSESKFFCPTTLVEKLILTNLVHSISRSPNFCSRLSGMAALLILLRGLWLSIHVSPAEIANFKTLFEMIRCLVYLLIDKMAFPNS